MNPTFKTLIVAILTISIIVTCPSVALSAPYHTDYLSPISIFPSDDPLEIDTSIEVSICGSSMEIHSESEEQRRQLLGLIMDAMQYLNTFAIVGNKSTIRLPIGNFFSDITGNNTIPKNILLSTLALHHSIMKRQKYENTPLKLIIADIVFYSFLRASIPEDQCDLERLTHEYPYIAFLEKNKKLPVTRIPEAAHQYQTRRVTGSPPGNKDLVKFTHRLFGFSYLAQGNTRFTYGNWHDASTHYRAAFSGREEIGESGQQTFLGLEKTVGRTDNEFSEVQRMLENIGALQSLLEIRPKIKTSESYLRIMKGKYPSNQAIRCLYAESLILNNKIDEATAELDDLEKYHITQYPNVARLRGKIASITGEGNPLDFYCQSIENLLLTIDTFGHLYAVTFLEVMSDDLKAHYPREQLLCEFSRYLSCIIEHNKFAPLLTARLIIIIHETCKSTEELRTHIGTIEEALSMLKSNSDYTSSLLIATRATILDELQKIYAKLGRYEEAIALCEEMAEITADELHCGENFTNIATYYYKLGEHEKALRYADHAIALDTPLLAKTYAVIAESGIAEYLEPDPPDTNRLTTVTTAFKLIHKAQNEAQDENISIDDELEEFSILLLGLLSQYNSSQDIVNYIAIFEYIAIHNYHDFIANFYSILQRCHNAPELFPNISLDSIKAILRKIPEVYETPENDTEEYVVSCASKLLRACEGASEEYDPSDFKTRQTARIADIKENFTSAKLLTEEDIQASDIDLFPYNTREHLKELTVSKYKQKYPYLDAYMTIRPELDNFLDHAITKQELDEKLKDEHDDKIFNIFSTLATAKGNISSSELLHDEIIFAYRAIGVDEAPVAAEKLEVWLKTQKDTGIGNKILFNLVDAPAIKNYNALVAVSNSGELEEYTLSIFCKYAFLAGYSIEDIKAFISTRPKKARSVEPYNELETYMWLAFGDYVSGKKDNTIRILDALLAKANTDIPKYGFIIQPVITNFYSVIGATDAYLRAIEANGEILEKIEDPDQSRFVIIDSCLEEAQHHSNNFGVSEPIISFQEKALAWLIKNQDSHVISREGMPKYTAAALFYLAESYYKQGLYLNTKAIILHTLKTSSISGALAIRIYTMLGNIYSIHQNPNRSIIYRELALAEMEKEDSVDVNDGKHAHAMLYRTYANKGNIPKALEHYSHAKAANNIKPDNLQKYASDAIAEIPDERNSFVYERAKNNVLAFIAAGQAEIYNAFNDAREATTDSSEIKNLGYVLCEIAQENQSDARLIARILPMLHDITIDPQFEPMFSSMAEAEMERIRILKHATTTTNLAELKQIDGLLSQISSPEASECRRKIRSNKIAKRQIASAPGKRGKKGKGKGNGTQLIPCSISDVPELIAFLGTLDGEDSPVEGSTDAHPPAPPTDPGFAEDGEQDQTPKPIYIGALVNTYSTSPYCYAPKDKLLKAAQTAAIKSADELPHIALAVAIEHHTEIHGQKLANAQYRITTIITAAHTDQWKKSLLVEILKYLPNAFLTDDEIINFTTPHKAKKPKKVIEELHSEEIATLSSCDLDEPDIRVAIATTTSAIATIDNRSFSANMQVLHMEINQIAQKNKRQEAELKRKERIAELKGKKNFALLEDEDYDVLCPLPLEEAEVQSFELTGLTTRRLQTMNAIRISLPENPCYISETSLIAEARAILSENETEITNPAKKATELTIGIEANAFSKQYSIPRPSIVAVLTLAHKNNWNLINTKSILKYFNIALIPSKTILELLSANASEPHSSIIDKLHEREAISFSGVQGLGMSPERISQALVPIRMAIAIASLTNYKERRAEAIRLLKAQNEQTSTQSAATTPPVAASAEWGPIRSTELDEYSIGDNELTVVLDSTSNSISLAIMPSLTNDTLSDFFNKNSTKITQLFQSYFRQGSFKAIPGDELKLFTITDHTDPELIRDLHAQLLDYLHEAYNSYLKELPSGTDIIPWNDIFLHKTKALASNLFPVLPELLSDDLIDESIRLTIIEENKSTPAEAALTCISNLSLLAASTLKKHPNHIDNLRAIPASIIADAIPEHPHTSLVKLMPHILDVLVLARSDDGSVEMKITYGKSAFGELEITVPAEWSGDDMSASLNGNSAKIRKLFNAYFEEGLMDIQDWLEPNDDNYMKFLTVDPTDELMEDKEMIELADSIFEHLIRLMMHEYYNTYFPAAAVRGQARGPVPTSL